MDTLLPKTTVGFVSATNSVRLTEQWNKTQLGKLMADPVMKPFEEDLRAQLQAQWSTLADRLGIHLDDLRGVSTGEASLALSGTASRARAATSLLLDVTRQSRQGEGPPGQGPRRLKGRGAQETIGRFAEFPVYVFDVPLPAGPAGCGGAGRRRGRGRNGPDGLFPHREPLRRLRRPGRRAGHPRPAGQRRARPAAFPRSPAYQMVMKRCAADAPEHVPGIRWFIYPLGYAEATRAATPPEKRRKGKTVIEIMRNQGYAAFQGVGGYVDVSADGYQILHRTAVFAPPPYTESMKMFVFPNGKDFTPQPWVGRDVATYFTVYVDILNAFDNFGPLYDEIIGEKGVWTADPRGHERPIPAVRKSISARSSSPTSGSG